MSKAVLFLLVFVSAGASAVDWGNVPETDITLFHAGQSAWEWVLVPSDHDGGKQLRQGKSCLDCHEGEEQEMGALIASGEKLEPNPVSGRPSSLAMKVSAAMDGDNLLIRMRWQASAVSADPSVTVMVGSNKVREFSVAGCWAACHNDLDGMPNDMGLTKYLGGSRSALGRTGGGTDYKSGDELTSLREKGYSLDYWQAKIEGDAASASAGYILDKRHEDEAAQVQATTRVDAGMREVILSRPLGETLEEGGSYRIGFAIHAGTEGRNHLVSLSRSLAIGAGEADIVAAR